MIRKDINLLKYRKIIKEADDHIYHDKKSGRMIKLDEECAHDMKKNFTVYVGSSGIDELQIIELSGKQKYVNKSSLPSGIIYYNTFPVGVIYPKFFEGYKTFRDLYKEDADLIYRNLRTAYYNNLELMNNDIFNKDLAFKNIMYNGEDVQLVDLDGHMVGKQFNSSYRQVYDYFMEDLYFCIKNRMVMQNGEPDLELLKDLKTYLISSLQNAKEDTPLEVINEIEKQRILK